MIHTQTKSSQNQRVFVEEKPAHKESNLSRYPHSNPRDAQCGRIRDTTADTQIKLRNAAARSNYLHAPRGLSKVLKAGKLGANQVSSLNKVEPGYVKKRDAVRGLLKPGSDQASECVEDHSPSPVGCLGGHHGGHSPQKRTD